jgi:hypothetical protein
MPAVGSKRKRLSELTEDGLNDFYANGDVTLLVGPEAKKIKLFKHNLIAISPVFEALFTNGMKETSKKEIKLPEDNPEAIKLLILTTIPWTNPIFTVEKVKTLLPLIDKYQIDPFLKEKCDEYLSEINSTWEIVMLAEEFDLPITLQKAYLWIGRNAILSQKDPKYLTGELDLLPELLTTQLKGFKKKNLISIICYLTSNKFIKENIVNIPHLMNGMNYKLKNEGWSEASCDLLKGTIMDCCPLYADAIQTKMIKAEARGEIDSFSESDSESDTNM